MSRRQLSLVEVEPEWRKHWRGMPEFVQDDLRPKRSIIVHFRGDDDVVRFAELLGQTISPRQKSLWYPPVEIRVASDRKYVDES